MIPYGKQTITQSDIDVLIDVLRSDFLTQGPKVPEFETLIKKYCGAKYGVAVNSATSALHIACLAIGLKRNDYLWTTPNTFVASANCGLYCGANIDFVDIDYKTLNMSVEALEKKLIEAKATKKLPKIVIPVHFAGEPCDMKRIHELSLEFGFKIIEDASHAIGAEYLGQKVGGCNYSDITIFSFHPVKIITTAEGGLATTNNENLACKMNLFRSHGITKDPSLFTSVADGSWFYQQVTLGYNYRMTDLHAALGISQMNSLESFIKKRHNMAAKYDEALDDFPVIIPFRNPESRSSLHLYTIQIKSNKIKKNRAEIFDDLRRNDIGVNVHYIPIHTHPYFKSMGFSIGDFPIAENYYKNTITLPLFPSMLDIEQDQVIMVLRKALLG